MPESCANWREPQTPARKARERGPVRRDSVAEGLAPPSGPDGRSVGVSDADGEPQGHAPACQPNGRGPHRVARGGSHPTGRSGDHAAVRRAGTLRPLCRVHPGRRRAPPFDPPPLGRRPGLGLRPRMPDGGRGGPDGHHPRAGAHRAPPGHRQDRQDHRSPLPLRARPAGSARLPAVPAGTVAAGQQGRPRPPAAGPGGRGLPGGRRAFDAGAPPRQRAARVRLVPLGGARGPRPGTGRKGRRA